MMLFLNAPGTRVPPPFLPAQFILRRIELLRHGIEPIGYLLKSFIGNTGERDLLRSRTDGLGSWKPKMALHPQGNDRFRVRGFSRIIRPAGE